MIGKLRRKFIILSMLALFFLLAIIVAGMNIVNYHFIVKEADSQLSMMSANRGVFPEFDDKFIRDRGDLPEEESDDLWDNDSADPFDDDDFRDLPRHLSPESPYEARYFSVLFKENGEISQTDTGRIKAVDSEQAILYARQVLVSNQPQGFIEHYRFLRCTEGENTRIIFLDCGQKLDSFSAFLEISGGMALLGYLIFFFVIYYFSGKIIRPAAESYEKQKRFITDAGHEIKTPLTIIQADADVLEMECGENEWLTDIQKQAKRLTALTNDLVYLARMEEAGDALMMIEFPLSDLVSETAASFQALALTQEKEFHCRIQPMISYQGNEKALQQLINLLLDNALKYSPPKGAISLTLEKQGRWIQLSIVNTTTLAIREAELALLFDRFYRTDTSRDSQTGGYGIGLSVAKAIVEAHNGKIQAKSEDPHSLQILVSLPI